MNKFVKACGSAACLLAILATLGGHWALLQSVAWARMVVRYAQRDPLAVAVTKALDGRHPCALCLKIREGQQKEQREGRKLPWLRSEKPPEWYCETRPTRTPRPPTIVADAVPFVPRLTAVLPDGPPTPPPRLRG